jgi:hypothetical protein
MPHSLDPSWVRILKGRYATMFLLALTLLVLLLSLPGSLRDAYERGGLYLFSQAFFDDIPRRLAGVGRFRFIMQPLVACILGSLGGMADARAGRPPYLYGILFHHGMRRELMRSALKAIANLLLMGILLDAVFQWVLFGVSHPGAALVIGPTLIALPYTVARALANRLARSAPRFR